MLQEVGLFYSSHQIVYRASTKLWSHLQRIMKIPILDSTIPKGLPKLTLHMRNLSIHEFLNYVELKQAAFRSPRHWYLSEKRL
jgi:hypothetical protein